MEERIINIVRKVLELDNSISNEKIKHENLFALGMTSILAIQVIILIESEFDIVFEDDDLTMDVVETINSIQKIVNKYVVKI